MDLPQLRLGRQTENRRLETNDADSTQEGLQEL